MFEKFDWLLDRYQELSEALSQPDTIANQPKWQALLKEHASLEPSVEAYRAYQQLLREEAEAQEMLEIPEMAELAKSELSELRERPGAAGARSSSCCFCPKTRMQTAT